MPPQQENRKTRLESFFSPWPALPALTVALVGGSFLYVWLRVETVLEYHRFGPYFYGSRAFLDSFLHRPVGLGSYAGTFIAQLNCSSALGALVFTSLQGAVFFAALFCMARISGKPPGFVALAPPFLLLLLRNHYGGPLAAIILSLVLALGAAAGYFAIRWRGTWLSVAISGAISAILFILAGFWAALLFGVLTGLFLSRETGSWRWGAACLVLSLASPLLAALLGSVSFSELAHPWGEGIHGILTAAVYASTPVAAAALAIKKTAVPGCKPSAFTAADGWILSTKRGQSVIIMACLLGWMIVWLTFPVRQKALAEIDYHANRSEYEAVLAAARRATALDHPAKVRLQLALFHTGRLAEDLFLFLNRMEDVPVLGVGEDWRAQSRPLFELGLINDAEHMAHEALEIQGDRPDLLRLLAQINLVKNRPQAAQVFMNVLSLIPFQGANTKRAWPGDQPESPAPEDLDELLRARAQMMTKDVPHDSVGPMLDVLLASNPTNRMAFEYAMAHHLINLDLKKAVERMGLIGRFQYARIPRSYEEALLLYQQLAGVQVDLKDRTIRLETIQRFRMFRQTVRDLQGTSEDLARLAGAFGDTYWCYYYANLMRKRSAAMQSSQL